jgi:iron(III) transport system substrate-binding protein
MKLRPTLLLGIWLVFPAMLGAQSRKPATIAEIATYMGGDREQVLYAGAKMESVVTWYTSLAGDSYKALSRAFESAYPGLRVEAFRSGGSELTARMSEEAEARRPTFDALETTYDFMMVARAGNLTRPYNSPALAAYPNEAKEKAEKGLTFWTIFRESYMGFGYSKEQVPPSAAPKGFDGLLNPQLKGKMGITLNESSARMIGAMIKIKGAGFVKKLKAQDIRVYTVSSAALVDLMASGELVASFHIYRNHALVSAERGSPVAWTPLELVPTNSGCVALAAQPPHPHAAALFVDFLLSPSVRKVLEKFQYGHPSNEMPFKRWHPGFGRSLEQFERDSEHWERLAKEISQR